MSCWHKISHWHPQSQMRTWSVPRRHFYWNTETWSVPAFTRCARNWPCRVRVWAAVSAAVLPPGNSNIKVQKTVTCSVNAFEPNLKSNGINMRECRQKIAFGMSMPTDSLVKMESRSESPHRIQYFCSPDIHLQDQCPFLAPLWSHRHHQSL